MTLVEFLLERISEDEEIAQYDLAEAMVYESLAPGVTNGQRRARRALAECEAKRRIVELHDTLIGDLGDECRVCVHDHPCATLRFLALPYSVHRDYNEEWRL